MSFDRSEIIVNILGFIDCLLLFSYKGRGRDWVYGVYFLDDDEVIFFDLIVLFRDVRSGILLGIKVIDLFVYSLWGKFLWKYNSDFEFVYNSLVIYLIWEGKLYCC